VKITDKSLISINLVIALLGCAAWLIRISEKLEYTKEIVERNEKFNHKTHEAVKQCQRDILENKINLKYLHPPSGGKPSEFGSDFGYKQQEAPCLSEDCSGKQF
jgi:hypothetical protein